MGERTDEFTGKMKQGFGRLTGNTGLEAEGEVQTRVARAKRKTKGTLHEATGAMKEGFGKMTGSVTTQAEGAAQKLGGKAEKTG